ncbi:MAG: type II toxin-antitoxin system VapC family toxin [Pseudomonadota bacterium]
MALVIDTSAVMTWLMPGETGLDLPALLAQHAEVAVPWLFWVEIRNALLMAERRKRLAAPKVEELLARLDALGMEPDTTPHSATVLSLCRDHRLTAYDALYLELALRRRATLATGDTRLAQAARASGVTTA